MYDSIIVGCGFAGATVARELAERKDEKVLVIEKRSHVAGNCYDIYDEYGIFIHQYGPHIFHTNVKRVYDFLSRFTEWYSYKHEVVANVHGKMIPVPFNLNTLKLVYGKEKAEYLEKKLIDTYGFASRVPILSLMEHEDEDIKSIADYIYQNIFLQYTMKQWGQKPEEIDSSVTARVPILISYDNGYFQDTYQGVPKDGYTSLVEKILDYPGITVELGKDAKEILSIRGDQIYFNDTPFNGKVIYTGPIDEFFDCKFGRLPYRSLDFKFEHYKVDSWQDKAVVNYTVSEEFTRITEFKKLTGQSKEKSTTIVKEYPIPYTDSTKEIPYYSIINDENLDLYHKYEQLFREHKNVYLLGRLAEYKYYNIDAIVEKALNLVDSIIG